MHIHLIRHGETDWNAIRRIQGQMESRLTEQGREQALALGERLQDYPISRIFCSSSVRTRETADLVFGMKFPDITYQDNLREIHLGPWEGDYYDRLAETDPEQFQYFWNEPHLFSLAGAETFLELQQRGADAIRSIVEQGEHDHVAVVSHGALIKSILCHFEDRPLSLLWDPPKMHNCAHSILEFGNGQQGRITRYADVDYRNR